MQGFDWLPKKEPGVGAEPPYWAQTDTTRSGARRAGALTAKDPDKPRLERGLGAGAGLGKRRGQAAGQGGRFCQGGGGGVERCGVQLAGAMAPRRMNRLRVENGMETPLIGAASACRGAGGGR